MKLIRKKIYDPIQRLCHFGIAFFTLLLILSAYTAMTFFETGLWRKSLWITHSFSGLALSVFFIIRIIWGIFGPEHAKFKSLWKFKDWIKSWKDKNVNPHWGWGHHPFASLAYLLFYLGLLVMTITGLILAGIEHKLGPFNQYYDELKYRHDLLEIHEFTSYFILLFILGHISALLRHELRDKVPIIQSMFSGFQYKNDTDNKEEEKNEKNQ
jgi:Ni/Fe-hydrogenase 1 B-type cytochrome subunit